MSIYTSKLHHKYHKKWDKRRRTYSHEHIPHIIITIKTDTSNTINAISSLVSRVICYFYFSAALRVGDWEFLHSNGSCQTQTTGLQPSHNHK